MNNILGYLSAIAVLSASFFSQAKSHNYRDTPSISYLSYQSENLENPGEFITISGQLRVPDSDLEKVPAVILLHGSAGVDSRGSFYAKKLNSAGIATFEIDMWAARGIGGGTDRPALPSLTVPDAFNALALLSQHSAIDAANIAVMGFSWGAVISMLSATDSYAEQFGQGQKFAAHIAHYPICWAYNIGIPGINFQQLTGEPVLIQIGENDDYDEGEAACESLVASLSDDEQEHVSLNVYKNSEHAWDRLEAPIQVEDPFSHLGAGGTVDIAPNIGAALKSRKNAVKFFKSAFE